MTVASHRLALSLDVEEWYHSGRWVNGVQARTVPDTTALHVRLYGQPRPAGEVVAPTRCVLDLLDRHACRATFFVLGEIARWYPDLVCEIADRGHEVACHGLHHVDMSVLGEQAFAAQLDEATGLLERLTGQRPIGFRAPNLVYEPWATKILEDRGYRYDSSVCASRPIGGKYKGWADAPRHPYHPSYDAIGRRGKARLIELPLPSFPVIRLNAGSGIMTRIVGYYWTVGALDYALRRGDTSYYFHPWEVGARPRPPGHRVRNALFLRRTGDWMHRSVRRLVLRYRGHIVRCRDLADQMAPSDASAS